MSDRYKGAILSPTAPTVTPQSAGGIYTSSQQLQYQGQGVWPTAFNNPLTNSLRFRSSASAYLSRTPASAGNRQIWTWSAWVKRGELNTADCLLGSGTNVNAGNGVTEIGFSSDQFFTWTYLSGVVWFVQSTQVFRDPSAWYHFVVAVDTTQATASNRVKMYVNGSQITALATATYPTQNYNTGFNSTDAHNIGRRPDNSNLLDGYLAEVNFVDGTQLTPSSFGTTDAYGIWQPIPYTGAYGTNGFYLPFTDNSALTTSSNVGLGKDFSGNGNYWVTNNISITAGSTYDSMKDVPTNTNSNTANYAVLNPLDYNSTYLTLSAANLQQTYGGVSAAAASRATMTLPTTGKWYWEVTLTTIGTNNTTIRAGICSPTTAISGNSIDNGSTSYLQITSGQKRNNATDSTYGAGFSNGQILQVLYDATAGAIYFGQNNSFANGTGSFNQTFSGATAAFTGLSGELVPCFITYGGSDIAVNFGQRPFSYTPPSGFYPLNTYNLPTPTILDGDQYMDVVTRTFTGASATVSSLNFRPDFLWFKNRTSAASHSLYDYLRGTNSRLLSNGTNAEITTTSAELTSFNSNGFTVGADGGNISINGPSGDAGVVWAWNAGSGTSVSNTQGTITSTVSANTTAGFSIVTYTGNGSNATVGHGLGVAPSMIIVKDRDTTDVWMVQHISLGATKYIILNRADSEGTLSTAWNNTAPTSSVFSIGTLLDVNRNSFKYVAYCFAQVAGYSAFGSYTGNGSTDGPFVYLGFRPKWVLTKSYSNSARFWWLVDTARNTYNVVDLPLFPNDSQGETAGTTAMDILSNGFKLKTTNAGINGSGETYIYMAFAENPFKIARGR